jgi:hypothetical protein
VIKETKHDDGTFSLDITCDICGQPITHADWFGMLCDNECEKKKFLDELEDDGYCA